LLKNVKVCLILAVVLLLAIVGIVLGIVLGASNSRDCSNDGFEAISYKTNDNEAAEFIKARFEYNFIGLTFAGAMEACNKYASSLWEVSKFAITL
jgi:NADH:ubiquinone oxidoreductase subunit 3 (subunit A)